MAHRKCKETKQQPSMLPVQAVPGSCLVSFHILRAILSTSVYSLDRVDLAVQMEQLAEWAALARAACLSHFFHFLFYIHPIHTVLESDTFFAFLH